MNKKMKMRNDRSTAKSGGLSFRRDTIRHLTADESKRVLGGMKCQNASCIEDSCPNSVCTITLDRTI